jgi:hypothetical protein
MQKITTSQKKTDLLYEKKQPENTRRLNPQASTIQKILQFASSYRVEQIGENKFVEMFLN